MRRQRDGDEEYDRLVQQEIDADPRPCPSIVWGVDRIADMMRFYHMTRKLPRPSGFFAMLQKAYSKERYGRYSTTRSG
jgi:hypothetical protein